MIRFKFKRTTYPAGETQITLDQESINYVHQMGFDTRWVWDNPGDIDIHELGQIADILAQHGVNPDLVIPYMPHGRQDRRVSDYDGHSLGVFAKFLSVMNFNTVTTLDAHSDVTEALFSRLYNLKPVEIVIEAIGDDRDLIFVAPDAGAQKKVYSIARELSNYVSSEVYCASKHRDVKTGHISKTTAPAEMDFSGEDKRPVYVIDDICDGGRTFIELAKVMPNRELHLVVSHGIFSNGVDCLFEAGYKTITTSDSFKQTDPRVRVSKFLEDE